MVSLKAFLRDYLQFNYSVPEIVERYVEWVSEVKYMILSRWNETEYTNEVFAVKCAKRGNDVYCWRVSRRFRGLCSKADDLIFFNANDRGVKRTRALWVTLTYDPKRCSFKDAWRNVGVEFNKFMAYIRKRFGKVSCCRVFESFENGYPHIHCILLFELAWFNVFRDRKGQFRVHSKKIVAKGWHSNVDVNAMSSLSGGFSYQKKYLLKNINAEKKGSKVLKTLALCWAYRKRAFSVSGLFRQLLHDLIVTMHNSNRQLRQVTLSGEVLMECKFCVLGFVPIDVVRLKKDVWFSKLNSEQVGSVDQFLAGCGYP